MAGDRGEGRGRSGQEEERSGRDCGDRHRENGGDGASTAEKAVMVASVAFTVLLFAYAGWQMANPPAMDGPTASVAGTEQRDDGTVAVTVRLRNPTDRGLVRATVESECTSPPVQAEFSYLPASTTRTATLVCPPGTTDPPVSVASWVAR